MGNEASANATQFTREEIRLYRDKYKKMEDTIMTSNETIRMLMLEKAQLSGTADDLRKEIAKRDEDAKRRLNDVRNSRKTLDSELREYKSVPEFEAILRLSRDLLRFQGRVEAAIAGNCDALQANRHDDEIERIKRRNAELFRGLRSGDVRSAIVARSADLREAEAELAAKKELARQEFVRVNGKLVQIKEKMAQATTKFASTVENSVAELRKNLQAYQREIDVAEQACSKTADSLIYERVKNILLQQENEMMKEMMASNAGSSSNNAYANPPAQKILNNLSSNPNVVKTKNTNANETNPLFNPTNTARPPLFFRGKHGASKENLANFDDDDSGSSSGSDDAFSIVDDDASETGSVPGRPKTYKIILLNVHEEGPKTDDEKVRMVVRQLTQLSLDDVDSWRIGKATGKPRPIVVAFDSFRYVQDLLKNRHSMKNTRFAAIRVCPYKSKPNAGDASRAERKPDAKGGPRKPWDGTKKNRHQKKGGDCAKKDIFS